MVIIPQALRHSVERRPTASKLLLGCGVVSSVWYVATDIIGTMRYPGYSWLDQEFSELTAQGSPVRSLMVGINEIPYTLLVLAFAVGVWRSAGSTRAGRVASVMLAGYAAAGFITGTFFPMATREILAADEGTLRNTMHIPGTMVMSLCIVLAMVFGSRVLDRRFRYYSYATIAALVVFGILASMQAGDMQANRATPFMGLEERVNIYATMLWVSVLAAGLWRGAVTARRPLKEPSAVATTRREREKLPA
jgi:hypothetical protein